MISCQKSNSYRCFISSSVSWTSYHEGLAAGQDFPYDVGGQEDKVVAELVPGWGKPAAALAEPGGHPVAVAQALVAQHQSEEEVHVADQHVAGDHHVVCKSLPQLQTEVLFTFQH